MARKREARATVRARRVARLVAGLVRDCPAYPPDPRQEHFYKALDSLRKDPSWKEKSVISMNGFPASWVDLGYLKAKAELARARHLRGRSAEFLGAVAEAIVSSCVQRVKFVEAEVRSARGRTRALRVSFVAKDDHGYYRYAFEIKLPATRSRKGKGRP